MNILINICYISFFYLKNWPCFPTPTSVQEGRIGKYCKTTRSLQIWQREDFLSDRQVEPAVWQYHLWSFKSWDTKLVRFKPIHPIHLYLTFEKSSLKNQVRRTEFLTCKNQFWNWFLKLIFAGYTGSKNPVWNRLNLPFVELEFYNLIFQVRTKFSYTLNVNLWLIASWE